MSTAMRLAMAAANRGNGVVNLAAANTNIMQRQLAVSPLPAPALGMR